MTAQPEVGARAMLERTAARAGSRRRQAVAPDGEEELARAARALYLSIARGRRRASCEARRSSPTGDGDHENKLPAVDTARMSM